jgi:outer membrane protein assembly factor BamB
MNAFSIGLGSMPFLFTLWIGWLIVTRNSSITTQKRGLMVLAVLVFGVMDLLRWDGMDGRQHAIYSPRWTPTAEQAFLATAKTSATPALGSSDATQTKEWAVQPGDSPDFESRFTSPSPKIDLANAKWDQSPPTAAWRHRVGPSWSSMTIVDGHLITQEQRGDQETVACYDVATGDELWAHNEKARFSESLSGDGPRATPSFCNNRLFSYGATGLLNCLSPSDGHVLWSKDVLKEAGGKEPQWGLSVSPLAVDNLVVVFAGGSENRGLIAYDSESGKQIWTAPAGTESYSSPQMMTIAGVRQVVMLDNKGLHGYDPADGKLLWEHLTENPAFSAMLQPHLVGDRDLVVGWDNGTVRLALAVENGQWAVTEVWNTNKLKPGFNDFVIHKDHIYGLDDGIFCCVDLETGKRLWKAGRYGFGQIILIPEQDRILVLGEKGDVILVAANPKKLEEVGRFKAIEGKTWNHPTLAHGKLFVRNNEEMACYPLAEPITPR